MAVTRLYITIDTEYDFGFTFRNGAQSRQANFARSIACATPEGEVGIGYQMDMLEAHGLKAVFFVDPMPALIWGTAAIEDIVGPVIARGHDVQLHIHTEWLELAGSANPVRQRTGRNIKDFSFEDQCILLGYARDILVAAGAPAPVAFRAGNYGANDDTLKALAEIGIAYDTSHCPGISGSHCAISLSSACRMPVRHCGLIEVPIGCIAGPNRKLRHAQLTAISSAETLAALHHCLKNEIGAFTLVSHSFELLSRDRSRVNRIVRRRFEKLCARLSLLRGVRTGTYSCSPPRIGQDSRENSVLPFNPLRTGLRIAEQAATNAMYGSR